MISKIKGCHMIVKSHECYFSDAVAEVKGFAIFMLDTNGVIQTWNNGCELMKGYKAEEVIGQNFDILFPEFLKEQSLHVNERQLAKEKGRYEIENWRRKKNGELFWASVVLTAVLDEEGNHIGFIKITQDQTEKKKYLDQLNINIEETRKFNTKLDNTNNELLKANSCLEEFTYASSHDLQAPLRKISIFTERLKKELWEQLNDQQQQLFDRITKSSARMTALIKDLLTYSDISKSTGEIVDVDLRQQVEDVLEDLELDILEKEAKFEIGRLPKIHGNERQLQQLFQNLISNSIKYTNPHVVPVIEISSCELKGNEAREGLPNEGADKLYHLIQVKDNGIGFQQEHAHDIFKAFRRLHGDCDYSGTGVGLAIVHKVVENHCGFIWAESNPGAGANFKILLPVSASSSS
jgi:PAS domain S-box-containing protein